MLCLVGEIIKIIQHVKRSVTFNIEMDIWETCWEDICPLFEDYIIHVGKEGKRVITKPVKSIVDSVRISRHWHFICLRLEYPVFGKFKYIQHTPPILGIEHIQPGVSVFMGKHVPYIVCLVIFAEIRSVIYQMFMVTIYVVIFISVWIYGIYFTALFIRKLIFLIVKQIYGPWIGLIIFSVEYGTVCILREKNLHLHICVSDISGSEIESYTLIIESPCSSAVWYRISDTVDKLIHINFEGVSEEALFPFLLLFKNLFHNFFVEQIHIRHKVFKHDCFTGLDVVIKSDKRIVGKLVCDGIISHIYKAQNTAARSSYIDIGIVAPQASEFLKSWILFFFAEIIYSVAVCNIKILIFRRDKIRRGFNRKVQGRIFFLSLLRKMRLLIIHADKKLWPVIGILVVIHILVCDPWICPVICIFCLCASFIRIGRLFTENRKIINIDFRKFSYIGR